MQQKQSRRFRTERGRGNPSSLPSERWKRRRESRGHERARGELSGGGSQRFAGGAVDGVIVAVVMSAGAKSHRCGVIGVRVEGHHAHVAEHGADGDEQHEPHPDLPPVTVGHRDIAYITNPARATAVLDLDRNGRVARLGRLVLCHPLMLRTSEPGILRQVDGGQGKGNRLRMPFMLPCMKLAAPRRDADQAHAPGQDGP